MTQHVLTLSFDGPICTTGEMVSDPTVDRPMMRDAFGRMVLPASLIKGRWREALEQMASLGLPDPNDGTRYAETSEINDRQPPRKPSRARRLADLVFGDALHPGRVTVGALVLGAQTNLGVAQGAENQGLAVLTAKDLMAPAESPHAPRPHHAQVSMDRTLGRALDQALNMREGPGFGDKTTWSGPVEILDAAEHAQGLSAAEVRALLVAALRFLDSVGADNQTGWGWITAATWDGKPLPLPEAQALQAILNKAPQADSEPKGPVALPKTSPKTAKAQDLDWLQVAIVLKGPLMVSEHKTGLDNFLKSERVLPGSAIKRALADVLLASAGEARNGWVHSDKAKTYGAFEPLARVFDTLIVSHGLPMDPSWLTKQLAQPSQSVPRPAVVPFTALASKPEKDVPGADGLRALLTGDWSSGVHKTQDGAFRRRLYFEASEEARYQAESGPGCPFAELGMFAHTRTAVDRRVRAAEDASLFTYLAIHPLYTGKPPTASPTALEPESEALRTVFLARIGFPKDKATEKALRQALSRVTHIGKAQSADLGSVACFEVPAASAPEATAQANIQAFRLAVAGTGWQAPQGPGLEDAFAVTLNTDALLLAPFALNALHGTDLTAQYEAAWRTVIREAGGPEITLHPAVGCVARQVLRGGRTARGPFEIPAPPLVLTRAGSTFVLQAQGKREALANALLRLAQTGVEIRAHLDLVERTWGCQCPYRASNGYGELIVCHPLHAAGPKSPSAAGSQE